MEQTCPHCGKFLKTTMGSSSTMDFYKYCSYLKCPYLIGTKERYQVGYLGGKKFY